MSSTPRSPGDKPESKEEPEKKKAGSPGRYSLADDVGAVPSTRIDSTSRMPAIRMDGAAPKSSPSASAIDAVPASVKEPPVSAGPSSTATTKDATTKDATAKPAIAPPSGPFKANPNPTQRAMPAPQARGAAPVAPPSQRTPLAPESKPGANARLPDVRPPTKSAESIVAVDEKKTVDGKPLPPKAAPPKLPPAKSAPAKPPPPPAKAPPPSVKAPSAPPIALISSLRPPRPPTEPPFDALSLEEFDEGSIAFAFDALVSEDRASQPGTHEFDLAPVRELFSALAANHMRHVRDFMIDVKWGEVTRDWIHICVPPVRTLRRAAEKLDLVELGVALEKLGNELDAANAVGGQMLDANEKQRLLDTYGELIAILPQAFALDGDRTQREAVIVQALLLQVPDVRKVTIDKLHAAGITSLKELFDANAHDIAHVAGIPHALATRIVDRVQAYRAELQSSSPQDARAAEREKLAALQAQLQQHHDAYEEAARGWGPDAKSKKRDHFLAREETWLAISVLLARFGEVDRLQGIEKVPFARRISQLSDYLEEARDKYRAADN